MITHELDVWKLLLAGVFLFIQPVSVDFELLLNIMSPIGTGDLFLFVPWFRAQILDSSSTTWTCVYIFSLFEFYIIRVNLFKNEKNGGLFISLVACLA